MNSALRGSKYFLNNVKHFRDPVPGISSYVKKRERKDDFIPLDFAKLEFTRYLRGFI